MSCTVVRETWGLGHTSVGTLTKASAMYVAGYVLKGLTSKSDLRLEGRHPEFARMSLRPGIGAAAMWDVASALMRYEADVPVGLKHGRESWPLGRYLRNKLREMTGREYGASEVEIAALAKELQLVREYAWANDRSVASVFEEMNEGVEHRLRMRSKRRDGI